MHSHSHPSAMSLHYIQYVHPHPNKKNSKNYLGLPSCYNLLFPSFPSAPPPPDHPSIPAAYITVVHCVHLQFVRISEQWMRLFWDFLRLYDPPNPHVNSPFMYQSVAISPARYVKWHKSRLNMELDLQSLLRLLCTEVEFKNEQLG